MFSPFIDRDALTDFIGNYWYKRALVIERNRETWADLPQLHEFHKLLAGEVNPEFWDDGGLRSIGRFPVQVSTPEGKFFQLFNPAPASLASLYNAGMSLGFVTRCGVGPLKVLRERIESELPIPGKIFITAFLSPPGASGVFQYVPQHVFFLQVSGEKIWQYTEEPVVPFPIVNGHPDPEIPGEIADLFPEPSTKPRTNVTSILQKGNVLYLPPGTPHLQRTETHSLHYAVCLEPETPWAIFYSSFRKLMMDNPEWRKDLRWFEGAPTQLDDPVFLQKMQGRVEELQAWANSLTAESIVEMYRRVGLHAWPGSFLYRPSFP